MTGGATPGPICPIQRPVNIKDGTMVRLRSPLQGPLGSSQQATKWERALCVWRAYRRAIDLAPSAVESETGYELIRLLKGLLPGLLNVFEVIGVTTVVGSGAGAVIGFFFGGAGAAPGAVVGGELGFDIGMAALSWLGLGFLAESIVHGFAELTDCVSKGTTEAWHAPDKWAIGRDCAIGHAASQLARAVGIFVRILLQGIVAYLLKNAALASTQRIFSTASAARAIGSEAVAQDVIGGLVKQLRSSKLGDGFADWVEKNHQDLLRNPKLRPGMTSTAGDDAAAVSSDRAGASNRTQAQAAAPAAGPQGRPKLPASPDELLNKGYIETSDPRAAAAGRRTFENPRTGDRLDFDKAEPGAEGFRGRDHYHQSNRSATSKVDQYLDKNGNPVPRGSRAAHLLPGE